ncbi:MFS transporter [Parasphingorhabdus sp.]|uniref:MFS transporter n=1 Tax=Parasphingorhabdus sp. TaxID=2709688 RepID=UPI002F957063
MASDAAIVSGNESDRSPAREPTKKEIRLVIAASSAGTIFEWYDFFIYGTLAAIIGQAFFPSGNETLQILMVWAGFAVGFGFRPLGAILFGYLGDKLGRKYTFLVTVTLMGIATAGVGLTPSAASIGIAAPIIVILLRVLQGLALGGEYGGAAIYVAEHAPKEKRGFYTSFIQASVAGGFVLSLIVVLSCKLFMSDAVWNDWGWRVPFLLSIFLLAISLWMRLKLSESPVFTAMKEAGEMANNPFVESFTYPGNKKRIFVALFGLAAGLTVIWYTAMFSSLAYLKGPMRIESTAAEIIVGASAFFGLIFFIMFGKLSDRIGRKKPVVWGYILTLILLFPLFWMVGSFANPDLQEASKAAPITVSGPGCDFNPFAEEQANDCGKLLASLTAKHVPYTLESSDELRLDIGGVTEDLSGYSWTDSKQRDETLSTSLSNAGYPLGTVIPSAFNIVMIVAALLGLSLLAGMTFGPTAALLSELFPPSIRYSSMSIPYHFGTGYFGGFLPFIASFIIAKTGAPFSGLWYTWGVVLMALLVTWWGLPNDPEAALDEAK